MRHCVPSIICVLTVVAGWPIGPVAIADKGNNKPAAPEQIDETPPLIPIPGAHVTKTGLLVGGQPAPEQLKAIHRAGYRTVVSLRAEDEPGAAGERAAVERLGMTFVSIPVRGAAGLTEDNARKLGEALDKPDALPAVVHCATGQRASAMLGLEAFVVDRVSAAAAIELAKRLGMKRHEAALRKKIAEICKADKSRHCEDVR
ncbi:MAG: sulfur transferase domain-containing protein [Myxococcales bacterium]|nr:sulfur transferase domain-containing protein [Myxococcales bacterium]